MVSPSHKQRAYHHIRSKLWAGSLPPGSRLSEVDLAKEIGISRTPLREAISRLESEGLVRQIPRFGAFVCQLTEREMHDLYDFRRTVETYAAIRAIERITPAQLEALYANCDEQLGHIRNFRDGKASLDETHQKLIPLDYEFHMGIVKAADNPWVSKVVGDYDVIAGVLRASGPREPKPILRQFANTWSDHRRLLRAIDHNDVATIQLVLRRHNVRHTDRTSASRSNANDTVPDFVGLPAEFLDFERH